MRGNEQRFRMFGLDPAMEFIPIRQIIALLHPAVREEVWPRMIQQIEERGEHAAVYRIVRPDGTLRWVSESGRVTVRQPDGRPRCVESVLFDITTHQESEAAIRESETRFRTLANSPAAADLDQRSERAGQLFQPGLVRLHGPFFRAFQRPRLAGHRPS